MSLYLAPSIAGSTTNLGLHRDTLYDVIDYNSATGNVSVKTTAFVAISKQRNLSDTTLAITPGLGT